MNERMHWSIHLVASFWYAYPSMCMVLAVNLLMLLFVLSSWANQWCVACVYSVWLIDPYHFIQPVDVGRSDASLSSAIDARMRDQYMDDCQQCQQYDQYESSVSLPRIHIHICINISILNSCLCTQSSSKWLLISAHVYSDLSWLFVTIDALCQCHVCL